MRVVIIGATGLVGALLVERLLANPGTCEVHALVRRPAGRTNPHWHEHAVQPREWPAIAETIEADAAVSALGTTWRAAGSEAAFRAVDFGMVIDFATAARAAGARRMVTVSSVGADAGSRSFYLRVKGEMEQALERTGFDRLDILRPGLLRGDRGAERRLGERAGIALSPLTNLVLRGPLDRFAAIEAALVADAAAACMRREKPGVRIYHNRAIRALARS